jgi:phosphoglycerate dehydrogenase-like enzyme
VWPPPGVVSTPGGAGLCDPVALGGGGRPPRLGGYAADVWCDEPPLETSLLADDRVLVTPHVAALTDTTYREICVRTAAAVAAIVDGRDPEPTTVHLPRGKTR